MRSVVRGRRRRRVISGILFGAGRERLEDLGVVEISDSVGLEAALSASADGPQWVFKHSTTCPISASAYRRIAAYLEAEGAAAPPMYLVKVIESRPVSNEIATRLGVRHESPQVLLVHGGKAVWSASHGGVDGDAMRHALRANN